MVNGLYRQIKKPVDWLHTNRHLSYPLVGEILKVQGEKKVSVCHGVECKITNLMANSHFCFFLGGFSIATKKNCAFWPCPDGRLLNPLGGGAVEVRNE